MAEVTAHSGLFRDTHLHVDDTGGPGRPVVLLHGWPLSGAVWKDQVPALTNAGFRVVTYDRRGFGRSDKPLTGYTYDTLTEDLHTLLTALDLREVTLVGLSMGGGEVVRYLSTYGPQRLRSVVFASAVPPYLMHTDDNPDGPLSKAKAARMTAQLTANQNSFYEQFITEYFTADGVLKVSEEQRRDALDMAHQASKVAALACMTAYATTDFHRAAKSVLVGSVTASF